MERKGWVKFHRKLLESAVFGNEKALKIWVWCLLKASHKEHEVLVGRTKLLIRKGQFIMGSERAVDELSLAKATIWYWLNYLEKEGQVRLQKTTKYTIVTLLNWEEYQEDLDTNETQKERKVGTYKNEENVKKNGVANAPREFEEVSVSDDDTPSKEKKDPVGRERALYWHARCKAEIGMEPSGGVAKTMKVINNALKHLEPHQVKQMIDDWFDYEDEEPHDMIQITRCLSPYRIDKFKAGL